MASMTRLTSATPGRRGMASVKPAPTTSATTQPATAEHGHRRRGQRLPGELRQQPRRPEAGTCVQPAPVCGGGRVGVERPQHEEDAAGHHRRGARGPEPHGHPPGPQAHEQQRRDDDERVRARGDREPEQHPGERPAVGGSTHTGRRAVSATPTRSGRDRQHEQGHRRERDVGRAEREPADGRGGPPGRQRAEDRGHDRPEREVEAHPVGRLRPTGPRLAATAMRNDGQRRLGRGRGAEAAREVGAEPRRQSGVAVGRGEVGEAGVPELVRRAPPGVDARRPQQHAEAGHDGRGPASTAA